MLTYALQELSSKTLQEVQQETALTWASRFWAARALGLPDAEIEEYRHEACEHAALAGDIDLVRYLVRNRS